MKNRGKVERRNRRRMEAIAYWMHHQSEGTEKNERAVVPYSDLKNFLTNHITKIEKSRDRDNDPEDLADEFLEFVKKRAGLLIEIGDNQYSFVHLTFQEYLTASHIITTSEKEGASGIWKAIKKHCYNARWHEVIRLLIADLKSDESQEFLLEKFLSERANGRHVMQSRLLGGFLLDGIEPAELRKEEIFQHLFYSACMATDTEQLRPIISMLRTCVTKDDENEEMMSLAFQSIWKEFTDNKQKLSLGLVAVALNWPETKITKLTRSIFTEGSQDAALFSLFLRETSTPEDFHCLTHNIEFFWAVQSFLALTSREGNFVAATSQAVTFSMGLNVVVKRAFKEQMVVLAPGISYGPFSDLTLNRLQIALDDQSPIHRLTRAIARDRALTRAQAWTQAIDRALGHRDRALALARDRALALARDRDLDLARALDRDLDRGRDNRDRDLALARDRALSATGDFWQSVLATPALYSYILDFLCNIFALGPRAQWWEALRVGFLPKIPQRITLFDESLWKQVENAFEKGNVGETEIYSAAWQLLFDSWLYFFGYYKSPDESIFNHIADLTHEINAPPLRIAHCIRDLVYGDESRTEDLVSMAKSDNPEYRTIFETCLWRPTEEEIERDKKRKGKRSKEKS